MTIGTDKEEIKKKNSFKNQYKGRFAPTPSGALHIGSLVTAIASYLDARKHKGEWYLRFDDIDSARVKKGSIESILNCLENHELLWDKKEIYQSHQKEKYISIKNYLLKKNIIYGCNCTRKELSKNIAGLNGPIYNGKCFKKKASGNLAYRIYLDSLTSTFQDHINGKQSCLIKEDIGDFIIWRKDNIPSYHFATVVGDNLLGINNIVRGEDLLQSTFCQIFIMNKLNYKIPNYCHIPLVLDRNKEKIGKSSGAKEIDNRNPKTNLIDGFHLLNLKPPEELYDCNISTIWNWGIQNWNRNKIAKTDIY